MIVILKGILETDMVQQLLTGVVTAISTWIIAMINKKKTVKRIQNDHITAIVERDSIIESLQHQLDKSKNGQA